MSERRLGTGSPVARMVRDPRKARGWSQERLAEEVERHTGQKIDQGTISAIENGRTPKPTYDTVVGLAKALDLDVTEALSTAGYPTPPPVHHQRTISTTVGADAETTVLADIGRAVMQLVNERSNIIRGPQIRAVPDVCRVPVINGMSATELASDIRQVEQWVEVPVSLLNGAKNPAAYVIVGDCLWERWGIKTGDTLIIDLANTDPRDGQIVAARINDADETAKEFYRVADGVDLKPTTKGYSTIEVRAPDQLLIIGVYVTHLVTGKR